MTEKQKQRIREGLCPRCGEWAYPYYLCDHHRITQNVQRVLNSFEKSGHVKVIIDSEEHKVYGWTNGTDPKIRKYSPETIAKMQLPRLNKRPMTNDIIQESIMEVLGLTGFPMTENEINEGIKQLKTIGKIIPNTQELINEFKLIKSKKSNMSKSQREAIQFKINFLLKRAAISADQLL